jgi:hypothetical protein
MRSPAPTPVGTPLRRNPLGSVSTDSLIGTVIPDVATVLPTIVEVASPPPSAATSPREESMGESSANNRAFTPIALVGSLVEGSSASSPLDSWKASGHKSASFDQKTSAATTPHSLSIVTLFDSPQSPPQPQSSSTTSNNIGSTRTSYQFGAKASGGSSSLTTPPAALSTSASTSDQGQLYTPQLAKSADGSFKHPAGSKTVGAKQAQSSASLKEKVSWLTACDKRLSCWIYLTFILATFCGNCPCIDPTLSSCSRYRQYAREAYGFLQDTQPIQGGPSPDDTSSLRWPVSR